MEVPQTYGGAKAVYQRKTLSIPNMCYLRFMEEKRKFEEAIGRKSDADDFFDIIVDFWEHTAKEDPTFKFHFEAQTAKAARNAKKAEGGGV